MVSLIAMIFYFVLRQNESVLKNIPADISYCFTINKQEYLNQSSFLEDIERDSLFQKIKTKFPDEAFELFKEIGIKKSGDLAVYGEANDQINLAWIGESRKKLRAFLKRHRLTEKSLSNNQQVKISDKLFLNYNWPLLLLSNVNDSQKLEFFNYEAKKLNPKDLIHPRTKNCLFYGFVIPDRNLMLNYTFIPFNGKAFVGLKFNNSQIEVLYIQPKMKLKGKLGLPEKKPTSHALLSWPVDSQAGSKIRYIPKVILHNINKLITKEVTHLYAEALDTISTKEERTQLDFDAEFQGSLKVFDYYKTYPGLRLEFIKKIPDNANFTKPTNLGLEIFKLQFTESKTAFNIESEKILPGIAEQKIPDYYIYADFKTLNTDPYWEPLVKTSFQSLELHAEPYEGGSVFILVVKTE